MANNIRNVLADMLAWQWIRWQTLFQTDRIAA
jgi:hypothetical protein